MDIISIASLGGFAFAAIVLLGILREVFKAWKEGSFVTKAMHEAVVAAGLAREAKLEGANAELRVTLTDLAKAVERLAYARAAVPPTRRRAGDE